MAHQQGLGATSNGVANVVGNTTTSTSLVPSSLISENGEIKPKVEQ
jgi:hypothetical protein